MPCSRSHKSSPSSSSCSSTSSPSHSNKLGCAQNPDGSLKNPSNIEWFHDKDDTTPLSSLSASVDKGKGRAPAMIVSGVRHSTRAHKPTQRVLDMQDVAGSSRTANQLKKKRNASGSPPNAKHSPKSRCRLKKSNVTLTDFDARPEPDIAVVPDFSYNQLKEMADADRQSSPPRPKDQLTADVRTIFQREDAFLNPTNGKIEKGHICTICSTSLKPAFFTGSVSTLHAHIRRKHVEEYISRCSDKIKMHSHALPEKSQENLGLVQSTLDMSITREPKPPTFTTAGLLDHIVELIVCEDKAFRLVDRGSFRRLLRYCRPQISERDIPHRTKIHSEILQCAKMAEEHLRAMFEGIDSKFSFTFDLWTSEVGDPYISITAHYVYSPPDHPNDWVLKNDQLSFDRFNGCHTAVNTADLIKMVTDKYHLDGKIGWFTSDGAEVNRKTLREFEDRLPMADIGWTAVQHDIICMEHALHLTAKHFVTSLTKDQPVIGEDSDEVPTITAGDSLGKALTLVKQIRISPQARTFFRSMCVQVNIKPLELLFWIRTRWGSLHNFLCRLIHLRAAVDQFTALADASPLVPPLTGDRTYAEYRLLTSDWERLQIMKEVLDEPSQVQQTFSKETTPTVWRDIPCIEFLIKHWESMITEPRYHEMKHAMEIGLTNLKKWYHRVQDTSSAYFICLILDPNIKDLYFKAHWDSNQYTEGIAQLEKEFDKYYVSPDTGTASSTAESQDSTLKNTNTHRYGGSFLFEAVQSLQMEKDTSSPRDELKRYLESPVEEVDNVVLWWGCQTSYPTLRRMARDYLAIQGSATPSERAFSSGGITDALRRGSLKSNTFGALQVLKSAYRNSHVSAAQQSREHLDALISDLHESMENAETMSDDDM